MKHLWKIAILAAVLAVFAGYNMVNAQGVTPPTPPAPGQGMGPGGMMGRGGMMSGAQGQGPMHDYMEAEIAAKLGMTVEELEAQHEEGKTFWDIAEAQGLSADESRQLMLDARSAALDAMVEEDVITQEQADWMKTRMSGMGAGGCRGGGMYGGRGMGGRGARW
jgi:hypothetical protein